MLPVSFDHNIFHSNFTFKLQSILFITANQRQLEINQSLLYLFDCQVWSHFHNGAQNRSDMGEKPNFKGANDIHYLDNIEMVTILKGSA